MNTVIAGNTELVEYGIQNEDSDLRAHVCPNAEMVYVYPTAEGKHCIDHGNFRQGKATQPHANGIVTGVGYLVPPNKIPLCRGVNISKFIKKLEPISYSHSTTQKGDWAVRLVEKLLKYGMFPLFGDPEIVTNTDIQREGIDIIVTTSARIQVKMDYDGGEPFRRGPIGDRVTGNLFLQIKECNPFRSY